MELSVNLKKTLDVSRVKSALFNKAEECRVTDYYILTHWFDFCYHGVKYCWNGYCSRRKAEDLIIAGKVKVNGKGVLLDISILYENIEDMSKIEFSIKEAYSNAKQKAEEFCESEMNKATGGMQLPFDMKSFL